VQTFRLNVEEGAVEKLLWMLEHFRNEVEIIPDKQTEGVELTREQAEWEIKEAFADVEAGRLHPVGSVILSDG